MSLTVTPDRMVADFARDGVAVASGLFSDAELDVLAAEMESLQRQAAAGELPERHAGDMFLPAFEGDRPPYVHYVNAVTEISTAARHAFSHPVLLDVITRILGSNAYFWTYDGQARCQKGSCDRLNNAQRTLRPGRAGAEGCCYDLDSTDVIQSFTGEGWIRWRRIQVVPLHRSPIGSLVPIAGFDPRFNEPFETEAFVPDDLPAEVTLPGPVWLALSDAMAELGRLDAAACLVPNPQLVTRIATRREAIGTSALEGTYANLTDLFAAEILPFAEQEAGLAPNVREVMNYTRAADAAYAWVQDRPITAGLISSMQAEIVRGTEGDGPEAGSIRKTQVFIGAKNKRVAEARFIPPPPGDQLKALYERWVEWLTSAEPLGQMQLIARAAMAHYQFETIHPYTDGNGRLGRLVVVLQFLREGALRSPVLSVSPWLRDHATEYRNHLLNVSTTGNWAPWIEFFAQAIAAESRAGHDRIMRLLALREQIGGIVRSALPRARLAVEIADNLIGFPILTVAAAHSRYGRTNQANRNAIGSLVELGLLERYGDAHYDRMYWNRRVFQIIDD